MSSYHSSFTYLNKNSSGEGFIISSFEPDSGFVDTYLGMDQIFTDSYDGVKKHFYGNKYNSSAEIEITLIKPDGSDFSMSDNRRLLRWLTGSRQASWLDLYVGDHLVYSFYGNITACQQQKLDARVVGIQVTFSSIYPWAWSAPQSFNCYIGQKPINIDNDGVIYPSYEQFEYFGIDDDVVYNSNSNDSFSFCIASDGVVYNDNSVVLSIDNSSDDLYTLTNLDVTYTNINSTSLIIENLSLGEGPSVIKGISPNEVINLSSGQFIISDTFPTKIFGDNFNFIWPKLQPGENKIYIDGTGAGHVEFSYRYPIKIGDNAIDVENLGTNPLCESDISGALCSSDGIAKLGRKNVALIDEVTNTPYIAYVKDGYLHVSESNDSRNRSVLLKENETGMLYKMTMNNNQLHLSDTINNTNSTIRDSVVLIDETNNKPYELTVKGDNLYFSEMQTYGGE